MSGGSIGLYGLESTCELAAQRFSASTTSGSTARCPRASSFSAGSGQGSEQQVRRRSYCPGPLS